MSALDEHANAHLFDCLFDEGRACTCGQVEAAAELAELKDGFALTVETEKITNRMSELAAQVDDLRLAVGFLLVKLAPLRARAERAEGWMMDAFRQARLLCPLCREYGFHKPECMFYPKGEQG